MEKPQMENIHIEKPQMENIQKEKPQMENIQMENSNNSLKEIFWTKEEDKILLNSIKQNGRNNWKLISNLLIDKSPKHCFYRYRKINPEIKKSKWIKEEDNILLSLHDIYGNNWSRISKIMKNRRPKQIRDRFMNNLDPKILRGKFSIDEDLKILELRNKYGNKWALISKHFENRSPDIIKSRYYSSIKNKNELLCFLQNLWKIDGKKNDLNSNIYINNENNDYNNDTNNYDINPYNYDYCKNHIDNNYILSSINSSNSSNIISKKQNKMDLLLDEFPEETETVNNSLFSLNDIIYLNSNSYISKSPLLEAYENKLEFDYNNNNNKININLDFVDIYNHSKNNEEISNFEENQKKR
jgi:hypothetical protein